MSETHDPSSGNPLEGLAPHHEEQEPPGPRRVIGTPSPAPKAVDVIEQPDEPAFSAEPEMVSANGANTALGSELFSANCSQCHGFAGAGGALTYGKTAPSLNASTPTQIYEAMQTGPEAMPVFGDGTITPAEKKDIIAYVTQTRAEANPGGFSLGRTGTTTEGLLGWLGGLGFLVLIAMWLTAKRKDHVKAESEQHS